MKCGHVLFVLLVVATPLGAQVQESKPAPDKEKQAAVAFKLPEGEQPIRLTLRPTPPTVPALKYRLLPELRDVKTGNAVMRYYRASSPEWQYHRRPEFSKVMDTWTEDVRKAPPPEFEVVRRDPALVEIDLGARRSYVDWEMTDLLRRDGINMAMPDLESFRSLAVLLAARARLEAGAGQFDNSVYSLQTGYKFGRDVAEGPTLIQALVGMTITTQMIVQTEELIQTPGSPNLYWALTDLPRPFISLQKPYQGERLFLDNLFPGVREALADKNSRSLCELSKVLPEKTRQTLFGLRANSVTNEWEMRLGLAALAAGAYPEARRLLLAHGWSKQEVESVSVVQAFVLLEVHNYDSFYDSFVKLASFPFPEARKGLQKSESAIKQANASNSIGTMVATLLIPAVIRVQEATARTDRRIAALRVVEALRLHAAAHDGKLPASLGEITEVPIPSDPMTGNPFLYRVEGDRATLFAPPPQGDTPRAGNVLMYELTLTKR